MKKSLSYPVLLSVFFALFLGDRQVLGFPESPLESDKDLSGQLSVEEIPEWKARLELARLLSYLKRHDESLVEYKKVLKLRPDNDEARMEMAKVLYWSGHNKEAEETLEDMPPDRLDEKARLILADLYVTGKRYDMAGPIYSSYLEKHPDDQEVRFKFATMLGWAKRYKESITQFEIILDAMPDDIQVRRHYALVLSWAGKREEAITEFRKTLGQ